MGTEVVRILFHQAQYKGIANTIVQLIRRSASGLIGASVGRAALRRGCARPFRQVTKERMATTCRKQPGNLTRNTDSLTTQSDLPDTVYAFPKQRKEPLTDAEHVRNAVARFDQVIDVSDADRALAFANIEKAANYYNVNLAETSWHELGIHPQKKRSEPAA